MYRLASYTFLLGLVMVGIGVYCAIGLIPKSGIERKIKSKQPLRWRIFEIVFGSALAIMGVLFVIVGWAGRH